MKSRTDNISSEAKTSKGIAYDSRWMIISAIALALFLFRLEGRAQLVSSNPMEYVALAEGNELINGQIKNQIEDQQKTALLQNTIAAEFTQIKQWERKYNSYLKTVSGYVFVHRTLLRVAPWGRNGNRLKARSGAAPYSF